MNKSKGLSVALIIILSIMAFLVITFMITAIIYQDDFKVLGRNGGETVIVKEKEYDFNSVNNIDLSILSSDIEVIKRDTDKIKITQYSNREIKDKYLFESDLINGTLRVEQNNRVFGFFVFGFIGTKSRYVIEIPTDYKKDINLSSVSSDININGNYNFDKAKISNTSGDIKISGSITADDIFIKTVSGDINVSEIEAKTIKTETTSGDIEILSSTGKTKISSVSGEVDVSRLKGGLDVKTTSGDILIDDYLILSNSNIKSVSGEVIIYLNQNSNCRYKASSVSGSIKTHNDKNEIGKEPFNNLSVKTTSGDIVFKMK